MLSSRSGSERGAILIHVAVASVVLIAFTMFIVDYGMLWVSRHQAQNSADAGALAAATALAYDDAVDLSDSGPAKQAGHAFALSNDIWGQNPANDITTDIRFSTDGFDPAVFPPECDGDACVRVDVFRNQARGNPLPIWFGQLVGLTDQGVRAMAIAWAGSGNWSDRVRPWAIPDRWADNCVPPGDIVFDPPGTCPGSDDFYLSCAAGEDGAEPEGCTGYSASPGSEDIGDEFVLKHGNPADAISPSHFYPIVLNETGPGGAEYRESIVEGGDATIGESISVEPGNMIGPTKQGVNDLIALDVGEPDYWSDSANCIMDGDTDMCTTSSPRLVCVPVFDPVQYYDGRMHGRLDIVITNLLGFFIVGMDGNDVIGILTQCPGDANGPAGPASFIKVVRLVR